MNSRREVSITECLQGFFSEEGTLSKSLPSYEFRPEQLAMATAVARAIETERILLLEAGTGVGKSLAYLAPAIIHAIQEEKHIYIGTGTKTLQHQLIEKELPFLKRYLESSFSYALCVGSENYVCERRLGGGAFPGQEDLFPNPDEISQLRAWAQTCRQGLRSELDFPCSPQTWHQICRVPELCAGQKCPKGGDCFYQRARARIARATVRVGNHHLLFADLQSDWEYLPASDILILDEAHNIDQTASDCLGTEFSHRALVRVWETLRGVEGRNCLIGSLQEIPIEQRLGVLDLIRKAEKQFHESIDWFLREILGDSSRIAVSQDTAVVGLNHFIEPISEVVAALRLVARKLLHDEVKKECEGYINRLDRIVADAKMISDLQEGAPWLLWCEEVMIRSRSHPTGVRSAAFHATPLEPGRILNEKLYPHFESSILVSATLSTGGDFSYAQERLGTAKAETLTLPSPFDYQNHLLLYTPDDLPDPVDADSYFSQVSVRIDALVDLAEGGTFVLCTSYSSLNKLYESFCQSHGLPPSTGKSRSSKKQISAFRQGDIPKERMLEEFKSAKKAVLFGAATFWQGVDVPGRDLELVIITRLPFQSPDDPVLDARIRHCRARGGNPFFHIQVPDAVMQFRQGIGRLIRSKTDRGVVAILDSRIRKKGYGKEFLASVPPCRVASHLDEVRQFFSKPHP